ncbi:hypothetical protein CAC42_1442 [Sphaceloma murrayae]|uniref:Concanavalin A-like lectin/glucanase n=1 Tax=Sphaceloma murrayae TaxID=2082308 RepID=A0A2K1QGC4_9PEZI|nr:hypothetical protein CAC42_1442 [Sphaceloma murrayae]
MYALLNLYIFLVAAAHAQGDELYSQYKFGNMFYTGPTKNGVYITKATYSLITPETPTGFATTGGNEELAFWIGVQEDPDGGSVLNENFVQPLLNWAPNQFETGCSANNEEWCITTSTYTPGRQLSEGYKPLTPGSKVDFEITVADAVTQKVWVNGVMTSQQTDSTGMKPEVFYGANECYLQNCGRLEAYTWSNITVVLSASDPAFGGTLRFTNSKSDGFETVDGGRTWTNAGVTIEADNLAF